MSGNATLSPSCPPADDSNLLTLRLTWAALVLSTVAIILSTVQALLAYLAFDNSEMGRRRCSEDIMGPLWAKKTKRKFLRSEFRYQVFFEVPVIYTAPPWVAVGPITVPRPRKRFLQRLGQLFREEIQQPTPKHTKEEIIAMEKVTVNRHVAPIYKVTGTDKSFELTMTKLAEEDEKYARIHTAEDEGCSWVTLLDALQGQERASRAWDKPEVPEPERGSNHTICYLMQMKRRCWDFMPLNVTKPFATTNLCHLVEIMSMLGLLWKEFDMKDTVLSAEGNGYMLKSEYIQGLGILTKFSLVGPLKATHKENRIIPCEEVKKLCFGEVPSILNGVHALQVGGPGRIEYTLQRLLPQLDSDHRKLFVANIERPLVFPVTFELIGMLAKSVHIRRSRFRMIPNPCSDAWTPGLKILSCLSAFDGALSALLKESSTIAACPLAQKICSLFKDGKTAHGQGLRYKIVKYEDAIDTLIKKQNSYSPLVSNDYPAPDKETQVKDCERDKAEKHLDLLDSIHDAITAVDESLESQIPQVREVLALHFTSMLNHMKNGKLNEALANADSSREEALIKYCFDHFMPEKPVATGAGASILSASSSQVMSSSQVSLRTLVDASGEHHVAVWLALVFRMWSWFSLHEFNPLDKMVERADFLGSRLPVYIG
ncbi:hypothetical protein BJ875DRAFT_487070 [Amylocarpus encephaloides]|uniref:Modin n=1 Tax=Amylocarpus encephaloides TaxID=45428 RepID=A0A9P8C2E4_9HELO|nr:hypothetical protein BJ875DRAFT_487070 [Amylocarpus encephaloides]